MRTFNQINTLSESMTTKNTERLIMTAQQAQDRELIQAVDLLEDAMGEPIYADTVIDIKIMDGTPVAYSIGEDGNGTDMPL
jgi:hypothetical protein